MKYSENYQPQFCEKTDTCRFALGKKGKRNLMIVGFNPSVADLENPDPTINRVIKLCEFNGYDGYLMVNVCPLISTDTNEIDYDKFDKKIAEKNLNFIKEYMQKLQIDDVLLAYGNLVPASMSENLKSLLCLIKGKNIFCVSKNKTGNPKHPLYAKIDKFIKYDIEI